MAAMHPIGMTQDWRRKARGGRLPAIAAILALHALGLYAALQVGAVRERILEAAPLFVSFIAAPPAPEVEAPPPKPTPVKPKPEPRLIATPRPTASAMQTPPQPVHEEPIKETINDPAPAEPPTPPAPPAPAAAAPVVPPNFVAAYLDNPAPEYPRLSRQLKESGKVLLHVQVSAEGRSAQVDLDKSSGYERLDQAAIEAVRKWRFVPAKQGEQAVAAWVIVPITFQLDQ